MKRAVYLGAVAALFASANGCSCQKQSLKDKLCSVDNVVVAEIIGKTLNPQSRSISYSVNVMSIYKGGSNGKFGEIILDTKDGAVQCGVVNLQQGEKYVLTYSSPATYLENGKISLCDFIKVEDDLTREEALIVDLQKSDELKCTSKVTCKVKGNEYAVGWSGLGPDGCNQCSCSDSGNLACTLMACADKSDDESDKTCEVNGKKVAVGWSGLGPDGCNQCSCSSSGNLVCTAKACALGKLCDINGKKVAPGWSGLGPDGCNQCTCSDSGNLACTLMACADKSDDESDKTCEVNGKKVAVGWSGLGPDGCNQCSCTESMNLVCTLKACAPKVCDVNGNKFAPGWNGLGPDGCNMCTCNNDGNLVCTKMVCQPVFCDVKGTKVPVGWAGTGPDGCNTCRCASNGDLLCSLKVCSDNDSDDEDTGPKKSCVLQGKTLKHGWVGERGVGCDLCVCDDGKIRCQEIKCPRANSTSFSSSAFTCEFDDTIVDAGWSGMGPDGCNTCVCGEEGLVCTKMACFSDSGAPTGCAVGEYNYDEGWSGPAVDGCNTCSCTHGVMECTNDMCG